MADPRETLNRIRRQADADASATVPALLDALEKVLRLHPRVVVLTADDLRNTPPCRELMAEAWEEGALHQARGSAETRRVLASALPNPYRKADA